MAGERGLRSAEETYVQQSGTAAAQSGDPEERHRVHRIAGRHVVGVTRSAVRFPAEPRRQRAYLRTQFRLRKRKNQFWPAGRTIPTARSTVVGPRAALHTLMIKMIIADDLTLINLN